MSLIISTTAREYPKLDFHQMKDAVLGRSYTLSLTFVGKKRAQQLNKQHRGASYTPNVLSFPLTDSVGEIYITPVVAKTESSKYGMTPRGYIGYLFIHGLLHLKGYPHGDTMDRAEKKYTSRFNLK
ncbi:MAG: rRNA maturation RNase YbeY [Candidatus Pacebacteria bacterium]|nr:rRNA maturation RNase YbeY [Candidatus Paceibacterota bacterium]MCF7857605.1 rRNA maturation RNase YbeY [Candidatus Paceibacterota bacterium]